LLADVRSKLSADRIGVFSDDGLVQMARDPCTQLEVGATIDQIMVRVRIVDKTELAAEIGALGGTAKVYYCLGAKI
jgi:hypothetical protein